MTRVLVSEFLLANAAASRNASASMLTEAAAMLSAIVTDFARVPNTDVTVLLSDGTTPLVKLLNATLASVQVISGQLHPETLQDILRGDANQSPYDIVLLIAPECDGVLVSLLKSIQELPVLQIRSLNLPWRLAEIFADKKATDEWLRQHHIATIPTKTIDQTTADSLRRRNVCISDSTNDLYAVLKPRDGAGSEGVQIVPFGRDAFQELPQQHSDDDHWLLQPFLPGIACSVGFIGGGQRGPATILPPARQNIVTNGASLSYHGGQIPCKAEIAARITPIAEQLVYALGPFDGYVGADLLVDLAVLPESEASVRVVEVNPRLCSSYVGYRMLAVENLATWMLQQNAGHEIHWKPETVQFSLIGSSAIEGFE